MFNVEALSSHKSVLRRNQNRQRPLSGPVSCHASSSRYRNDHRQRSRSGAAHGRRFLVSTKLCCGGELSRAEHPRRPPPGAGPVPAPINSQSGHQWSPPDTSQQQPHIFICEADLCSYGKLDVMYGPGIRRDGHLLFKVEMYLQKGCIMVSGVGSS